MAQLIDGVPQFELRKGIVHITDQYGERALSLGDFVAATKIANQLCRKWVAEANQPARVGALEGVKVAERRHR